MDSKTQQKRSQASGSAPPKQPKLKDSCTACANSKLKCSKEKPVCKRCELRGRTCEYETSKRTGRTSHATKAARLAAEERQRREEEEREDEEEELQQKQRWSQPQQPTSQPMSQSSSSQPPAPVAQMTASSDSAVSPTQDPLAWLCSLNPEEMHSWSEMWMDQQDFDPSMELPSLDPLESPTKYNTEVFDFEPYNMANQASSGNASSQPMPMRPGKMPLGPTSPLMRSSDSLSSSAEKWNEVGSSVSSMSDASFQDLVSNYNAAMPNCVTGSVEHAICCLSVVVGFLVQLFPNSRSPCSIAGTKYGSPSVAPTGSSIISENRKIIDELTKVLECQCSRDGYLLTIVSLVLFKTMSCYAGIVDQDSSSQDNTKPNRDTRPSSGSNPRHGRSYSEQVNSDKAVSAARRNSAKSVLSELHRVQRLVNLVSQRIEAVRELDNRSNGPSKKCDPFNHDFISAAMGATKSSSMSSASLDQLQIDLRTTLSQVSSEMIDILRASNS